MDPDQKKTLWVGDIAYWMDETYLARLFGSTANVASVKIIRDKQSNLPLGYGFVEFESHEIAAKVLDTLNGTTNPGTNKPFRLNWGVHNAAKARGKYGGGDDYEKRGGWGSGRYDGGDRANQISVSF